MLLDFGIVLGQNNPHQTTKSPESKKDRFHFYLFNTHKVKGLLGQSTAVKSVYGFDLSRFESIQKLPKPLQFCCGKAGSYKYCSILSGMLCYSSIFILFMYQFLILIFYGQVILHSVWFGQRLCIFVFRTSLFRPKLIRRLTPAAGLSSQQPSHYSTLIYNT